MDFDREAACQRMAQRLQAHLPTHYVVEGVYWPQDDYCLDARVVYTKPREPVEYGRCLDAWDRPERAQIADYMNREVQADYTSFVRDAQRACEANARR